MGGGMRDPGWTPAPDKHSIICAVCSSAAPECSSIVMNLYHWGQILPGGTWGLQLHPRKLPVTKRPLDSWLVSLAPQGDPGAIFAESSSRGV